MDIIIREYEETDKEAVTKLISESFEYDDFNKPDVKDDNVKEFVCTIDNTVVGYFYMYIKRNIMRNILIGDIEYVCVDPEYRGRGIGTLMMSFANDFAKKNNITRLELTSSNSRVAAHKLYVKSGFVKRDTAVFRKDI